MNILLYANCHGRIYKYLFNLYFPKYNIDFIWNHPIEDNDNFKFSQEDISKFKKADLFIYQPMNKEWKSQRSTHNVLKLLKLNCKKIRIPFIRFNGFWLDYNNKIINDKYNYDKLLPDWNEACKKFKSIEENSDINKIYPYFDKNYKNLKLFTDPHHPTALLFYHIFIQICNHKFINNKINFNNEIYKKLHKFYKDIKFDMWERKISDTTKFIFKLKYE